MDPEIGEAGDIDTSLAVLTFENGVVATVDNCRKATYGYDQRVEVFGSKVRPREGDSGLTRSMYHQPCFSVCMLQINCGFVLPVMNHEQMLSFCRDRVISTCSVFQSV